MGDVHAAGSAKRFGLLAVSLICLAVLTACDPGTELRLQIRNRTPHPVRVVLMEIVPRTAANLPALTRTGIDASLDPDETRGEKIALGFGSYAGAVRAYVDDRLVFCQQYSFPRDPEANPFWGGYHSCYSVETVENHIACGPSD